MNANTQSQYVAVYDPYIASQSNIPIANPEFWTVYSAKFNNLAELKNELINKKATMFTNFTMEILHPILGFLSEATFLQENNNVILNGKMYVRIIPETVSDQFAKQLFACMHIPRWLVGSSKIKTS